MRAPYIIKDAERVTLEYQWQCRSPDHPDDEAVGDDEFGAELVHVTMPVADLDSLDEEHRAEHYENKNMRLTDSRFLELS